MKECFPTDIGADEVDGSFILSLVVPPAVCFPNTVKPHRCRWRGSNALHHQGRRLPFLIGKMQQLPYLSSLYMVRQRPLPPSGTYYIKLEKGTCYAIGSVPVTINGTGNSLAGITEVQ